MARGSKAYVYDFDDGVRFWRLPQEPGSVANLQERWKGDACLLLEFEGDNREKKYLYGTTDAVPEASGHSKFVGKRARSQQSCGPSPTEARESDPAQPKAQGRMYQLETTAEEIKPVFTERFAVENISESCRSSRYRERTAVREIIISAKAAPSPTTTPVQVRRLVSLRSFAASQGPRRELTIAMGQVVSTYIRDQTWRYSTNPKPWDNGGATATTASSIA
jgi:hypothetical protein